MELLILSVLILLNGFFALSEIALVSSKKSRLEQKKAAGQRGAATALKLLERSENFLSAIQVGITLIGIVTGVYGGMNIADDVAPFFRDIPLLSRYAHEIALTLTVLLITYVSIVIGELVPKTIALNNPEQTAVRVAPVVYYFGLVFYPFVVLLSFSTQGIQRLIGLKKQSEHLTQAELLHMLKTASSEGLIAKEQNLIHEKLFSFADKKAKHLMTHRVDVEWVNTAQPEENVRNQLMHAHHSKIVCGDGSLDHFRGIVYLKDFYEAMAEKKDFGIGDILVDPLIVPESLLASKVLHLMREKKTHVCCVVNEYGGFEGLITLHDILESIAGEFPDASENDEQHIVVRDDRSVLVSGDTPVEALRTLIAGFSIDLEQVDYTTVAGFVFHQLQHIPKTGDSFVYNGHKIEIVDLDGNAIDKVLITPLAAEDSTAQNKNMP